MPNEQPLDQTNRLNAIRALVNAANRVHNGRYHVVRGPVLWSAFPFDSKPFGMSILLQTFPLAKQGKMDVQIEMFHALDASEWGRDDPFAIDIADTVLETLIADAREFLLDAVFSKTDAGYDAADLIGSPVVTELVGADGTIQGIRIALTIGF